MSIATVITGGFGTFGSVALAITDGYSIGAQVAIDAPGLHYRITGSPLHYHPEGSRMHYRPPGGPLHYLDDEP